jgi:hypothetical protein
MIHRQLYALDTIHDAAYNTLEYMLPNALYCMLPSTLNCTLSSSLDCTLSPGKMTVRDTQLIEKLFFGR